MRVLIVAANQEHKPDPVVPLGAAYVAGAAIAAGHEVRVFDACFLGDRCLPMLAAAVTDFAPDVVGISLRNIDDVAWPSAHSYLPYYRTLVAAAREASSEALIVLGGSAFTLMPQQYLKALAADCGVAGEGEAAFVELLQAVQRDGAPALAGRIFHGDTRTSTVRPALHLLDLAGYYRHGGALNVQTRRGCGFQCSYCTYPLLEGRDARLHDIPATVDDIALAVRDVEARHFFVVDNTFNLPNQHAVEFCEELIRRKLGVRWTAYLSPRGTTLPLLQLMAEAGCASVEFGTDAASPRTLRALQKSFDVSDILRASTWCREAGLRFAHSLILGGPDETPATLRETVRVIDSTAPDAVFGMLGVRLYPGTPLARRAERDGLILESEIGLQPVFYISEDVRDELEATAHELKAAHSNWYFPGLEGNRWVRYWRRRRAHGARGPLWESMGKPEVMHGTGI